MKFYRLVVAAVVFFFSSNAIAQIGINTITPDSSASLHILSKPSGSGLIIPELTETQRLAIAKPAVGLMVYDVTSKLFYVNLESTPGNHWFAINPMLTQGTTTTPDVMYTSPAVTKVGIGMQAPQIPQATLDVNGDIHANTAVSTNALNVTGFPTNALVPAGIITMWSGDPAAIPAGWALCDGKTYGTLVTPDLRGRFIVGYDPADPDYNYSGNKYGPYYGDADGRHYGVSTQEAKTIRLAASQSGVPSHTHTTVPHDHHYDDYVNSEDANRGTLSGGAASATETHDNYRTELITVTVNKSDAEDAALAHENRPPYYVLAYIIKTP